MIIFFLYFIYTQPYTFTSHHNRMAREQKEDIKKLKKEIIRNFYGVKKSDVATQMGLEND